jgi:Tol biopolymer transport system component
MTTPSRRSPRRLGALPLALVALVAPVALAAPAWASPTANEVVYTADDDNDGVYTVVLRDLESRRVTTVLDETFVPAGSGEPIAIVYDEPELSPDGGRIAMSSERDGGADLVEGIAVVNRDGSGFRRLTTVPIRREATQTVYTYDISPAWSPDGTQILFTRLTETVPTDTALKANLTAAIYTVPVAPGGTATMVPGTDGGYTADWSPDGTKIVYVQLTDVETQATGPLTVINRDGSGKVLLGADAKGYSPAWSPDGRTIAYSEITVDDLSDADRDVTQIATVPATGGPRTVLAATRPGPEPTVAEYPAWTPDGESIVFDLYGYTDQEFPPGDLWAVDRNGVRAGRVTATAGDEIQPHVHGPAPTPVTRGAESTYVPVTPERILDTRSGNLGAPSGKVGPGGVVELTIHGLGTAPTAVPSNATAVVLNVTVTGTTASTDVRVYPSGTPIPGASNVNAAAGQTVPNLVTSAIGANGKVSLRNSGGTVNLIADIAGYYVPATSGTGVGFAPTEPSRILETRPSEGVVGPRSTKVGPGEFVDLTVRGALRTANGGTVNVPTDATAVVLNVTATGATSGTDVRVYPKPADAAKPEVSNLNLRRGQTAANLVTVAVGRDGQVRLRNEGGTVDLVADIAGYYSPTATGRFVPVPPARFLDTRSGVGAAPIPVTAAGFVDLKVAGTRNVPAEASAVVLNLTGTGVTASTDVRAFPLGAATVPTVSNLNLIRGTTRANLAIVKTGNDGRIRVRNGAGQVNLIGDLAGYMIG